MATIPSGQKFHTVPAGVQTVERGSALANSQREIYTMQDVIDTVSPSITANPSVIDLKVTDGDIVTGITITAISQTIIIPANTFTSAGGALEFMARYRKIGTAGNFSSTVFINTSNTLTGASALAWFSSSGIAAIQGIRTARISANTLTVYPVNATAISDYASTFNAYQSISFDPTVDHYLLFTVELFSGSDSALVEMARAVKYE
jgi:hypothetical protein